MGSKRAWWPFVVGVWVCSSCARMCSLPASGWWVWVRFLGLGMKVVASRHAVGFTFNTVLASTCCGGCPRSRPDGLLGVVVCGGLFVICIVVASIFVLYCFLCFV